MGLFGTVFDDWLGMDPTSKQGSSGTSDTTSSSKSASQQQQATKQQLAQATPFQQVAENSLFNALQNPNFNPFTGQQQLAGQTNTLMQQLLNSGLNATPQQQALLQSQTQNYMKGLTDYLNDWQKGAMSQAQQSALARGIPLSDIARGMESNVQGQYGKQLAQGYNQAMQTQLQNQLQLPMQNLQLMSGLQNQFNSPLLQQLYATAMSRQAGPRDVTQTGSSSSDTSGTQSTKQTGTGWGRGSELDNYIKVMGMFANNASAGLGGMGGGGGGFAI